MYSGWIRLYRQIQDSKVWNKGPFSWGQAWVDLILSANHKPGTFFVRGVHVPVERGQLGQSEVTLATKWKWSRCKVRRFLKWLESEQQIVQQKTNVTSLITIVNYDLYQSRDTANDTANDTAEKQQTIQQKNTNKNEEECKQWKEGDISPKPPLADAVGGNGKPKKPRKKRNRLVIPSSPDFETWWSSFPNIRKTCKPEAFEIWPKAVESVMIDRMCDPAEAASWLTKRATEYASSEQGRSRYCRGPVPWLNQAAWNDPPETWLDRNKDRPFSQPSEPAEEIQKRQMQEFGGKFSPLFAHLEEKLNGDP